MLARMWCVVPAGEMMTHNQSFLVEEGYDEKGNDNDDGGRVVSGDGHGHACGDGEGRGGESEGRTRSRGLGSLDDSLPAFDRVSADRDPRTRTAQDYAGRTCAECHCNVTQAAQCCLVKSSSYYFCSEECWGHWLTHGCTHGCTPACPPSVNAA